MLPDRIPEKTLADLGWPALVAALAARCHTERGSAAAAALRPDGPSWDLESARARAADVAEARLLAQLSAPLPFGAIRDVAALVARAEKDGVLEGAELSAVGETVAATARLRRHLAQHREQAPRLWGRVEPTLELSHVSGPILDCIAEGGVLLDHASPALGGLRRRVHDLNEELKRRAQRLLDDAEIAPLLMDRFYTQREDRYVLPVRAEARGRLKGIVHGASQSGHTVFVEPEVIVELNNRLKLAESEVIEEERRILTELSGYVRDDATAIRFALDVAETLDLVDGAALLAEALEASEPVIGDAAGDAGGALELRSARHPLMALSPRACVPCDLLLAPGQTLVVSGPNAGGKTVALKTAGLCALMARAGLHIPAAPGSRVPFYHRVFSDIGDEQSLERNLSSFSAHLVNVETFLGGADARTLVLLDEMAVGTEPEQGAALAQAVLEALAERGAHVVVTTHYERLKALAASDPRFVNASVGFDLSRMAPTFQLQLGVPGSSGALLVARRMGLPAAVCARAEALLGDRRAGVEELLIALAEERRRLDAERREAATARREAEEARREAEADRREADRRLRELKKGAHDQALAELRRARDEIARVDKLLRKAARGGAEAAQATAEAKQIVAGAGERIAAHAPAAPAPEGRPAAEADLRPGVKVLVARLGGRGEVVAAADRGRVTVQLGTLRTTVDVADVRLDDRPPPRRAERRADAAVKRRRGDGGPSSAGSAPPPQPVDGTAGEALAPARTPEATCDLRGERVDDGLIALDRFLDDALLASREVVFVIHGHGTGAMKAAVREHLDAHPAVLRARPGTVREGGDGITVAWLDV